ncbi:MAG TPA: ATP F0F1 synthase subunit B, partial [Caulobacterales bacterium]|nr:ATP F0F1 synthase subunit B [Caulobacterales bacterium]
LARHERAAADKIARAEAQALADVRAAAAEAAVQAAEKLLRERLTPAAQAALVDRGVAEIERKLAGA